MSPGYPDAGVEDTQDRITCTTNTNPDPGILRAWARLDAPGFTRSEPETAFDQIRDRNTKHALMRRKPE